mmetsp:Transcript_154654/g.273158  ORF Transcript_154654/g.273158 Transcript_154654/m.273158 type:complete len:211 (-) Transcript_154654:501-1133(-)
MDATLRLGATILIGQSHKSALALTRVVQPLRLVALKLEVLESHGAILWDRDGVLRIPNRRVALCMQWMVWDLVLGNVFESILQGPVSKWVALGQATTDGCILESVDPCTLETLPASAAVDHAIRLKGLQATLERFHFADLVVLLDVLLPQVGTVLFVVRCFITHWHALRTEDLCLEAVVLLNALHELHGLIEEMESVNHHDLDFAILEVA